MPSGLEKIPTMNKDQTKLFERLMKGLYGKSFDISQSPLFKSGESYLQNLLSDSPEAYEKFKAPMMTEFQQEIMPEVAERFAGLGATSSSGFQQTVAQEGSNLAERLGALRSGLQMQALPLAQQQAAMPSEMALRRASLALGTSPFAYLQKAPKQPGAFSQFMGGLAPALGAGIGMAFGGPVGAAAGSAVGGGLGNLFGGGQKRTYGPQQWF